METPYLGATGDWRSVGTGALGLSGHERLEKELGHDFAQLLVLALSSGHGRFGSSSP
jgi:hypothetical protein